MNPHNTSRIYAHRFFNPHTIIVHVRWLWLTVSTLSGQTGQWFHMDPWFACHFSPPTDTATRLPFFYFPVVPQATVPCFQFRTAPPLPSPARHFPITCTPLSPSPSTPAHTATLSDETSKRSLPLSIRTWRRAPISSTPASSARRLSAATVTSSCTGVTRPSAVRSAGRSRSTRTS